MTKSVPKLSDETRALSDALLASRSRAVKKDHLVHVTARALGQTKVWLRRASKRK